MREKEIEKKLTQMVKQAGGILPQARISRF